MRLMVTLFLTLFLLATLPVAFSSLPENIIEAQVTTSRIAGTDRYETAAKIARVGWKSAETVILARGDSFPDALAGTPLAYQREAPLLLTYPDKLNPHAKEELQRLNPDKVILLGGKEAISPQVEREVEDLGHIVVERIGGENRYQTARLIARELPATPTVILAYGGNFPDALAAASFAASRGYPILLSPTGELHLATKTALEEGEFTHTLLVGGTAVLSDSLLKDLPNPMRIAGKDRYETAVKIMRQLNPPTDKIYLARGTNFADALTGSALAAREKAPLLLVRPNSIPGPVKEVLQDKLAEHFVLLGGPAAITTGVEAQLRGEIPYTPIIYPGQKLIIPGKVVTTPSPSQVITRGTVEGKTKQIALTFDSGWLYEQTFPLLKVLDQQGVKATFFPRALWVYNKDKPASSYPYLAREIVKRGHTMGNHSLTHPDMRRLSEKEIRYEIKESTAIIKNITGVRPYLFRPPYGAYDHRVLKILGEEGYPYTIMWTIDTHDWASEIRGQKVTEDYIVKRVLDNATNNGIVLMHIGGKYTVGALPRIITGLRAKGYTFTTVDKMLPPPKREQYIYTVKAGDTLYRIAQNYGVTVEEIIKANKL